MKIDTVGFAGSPIPSTKVRSQYAPLNNRRSGFFVAKRTIDLVFVVLAIPILLMITVLLYFANIIWNPGSVFFRQVRMGRDGKAFKMWKFRTMIDDGTTVRAANAPLDEHRITPLGRLLRRTKLDELPNILNILTGDMSLVGPRPDAFEHATAYLSCVPHYRKRFSVRPGITGLAQVRGGYAASSREVRRKARYDNFYIQNLSLRLDLSIIASTFAVVFSGSRQR